MCADQTTGKKLTFQRAAILGATGPTGKHLARELKLRGISVRAVSRSEQNLRRAFADPAIECVAADVLDVEAARRAIDGCDVVFNCVGLPMDRIADHPRAARSVAAAIQHSSTHCIYVTGYWAYLPVQQLPISEAHPRSGGNTVVRLRREAEDILCDAGAAIVNLPDFYGPEVYAATLQQALTEALVGKVVNWIGSADTAREYIYVPDAMTAVAELACYEAACGEHWIVPGGGPLTLTQVLRIAERHLGKALKARGAGVAVLRLLSLFSRQLREFMPMVPTYVAPISFDGRKLRALIGDVPVTPYEEAIARTLDWLGQRPTP
ncbi:MAG: NAD(P)H-binding protein [Acidiferrobacterales bacterium]